MVEKLEPVDLRDVWSDEAKDFTPWLFDNLDLLGEQLGVDLSALEREKSVGTFSADLFATDKAGHRVIIENQLEKTDHDHLGKVLTYLSNLEAKTAIWITSDPRPEHVTAMNYLNEVVPDDTNFYLVRVQAFRIGDSDPAPMFTVVAGPSPEIREAGKAKKRLAEGNTNILEFFTQLLDKSKATTNLFENISPVGYQSWLLASAKKAGMGWQYVIRRGDTKVELVLYSPDSEINMQRFNELKAKKTIIEEAFEESLEWDYKETRKQQYIRSWIKIGGYNNEEKWSAIQDDMVDRMVRLEKAFRDHITALT